MRSIRTIIVDDEVLGRARIRKLLAINDRIQIVGEGANGTEAIRLIEDYKPDRVFLDIEMPDKNGFQAVDGISIDERPFIVFVTAHDRFALKAFDVQATDFVLKPYDDERFFKALDFAIKQIEMKDQSTLNGQLIRIMDDYRSKSNTNPFMLTVKVRGVDRKINLYDVISIEADGNYLKLQLEKERFLLRNTMQQMLEELDDSCFLRVHRSVIININSDSPRTYQ